MSIKIATTTPALALPDSDDEFDIFVGRERFVGIQHVKVMEQFLIRAAKRFHELDAEWRAMKGDADLPENKLRAWTFLSAQFTDKNADLTMFFSETEDYYDQPQAERKRLNNLANALVNSGRDPALLSRIPEKFYLGTLLERNGEREYSHKICFRTNESPEKFLELIASNYLDRPDEDDPSDKGFYFNAGSYYVEPRSCREISEELYLALDGIIDRSKLSNLDSADESDDGPSGMSP